MRTNFKGFVDPVINRLMMATIYFYERVETSLYNYLRKVSFKILTFSRVLSMVKVFQL